MLLRPKDAETTPLDELLHEETAELCGPAEQPDGGVRATYRFVDINAAVGLGAQAVLQHQEAHPDCDGQPTLMADAEERRGLAVSELMSCQKCGFCTDKTKLFTEIAQTGRGRRTATPNMAFMVGLYNTGISTAGARRLLSAMDTTVPSGNSLQNTANKCGEIINTENHKDMSDKRTIVKDIHELQGYERDSAIAVETDRQYNNPLRNCRKKTPFIPATQTRDVVCENVTANKYVVMYHQENKLCKKCDNVGDKDHIKQAGNCTATRPAHYNMGNEREGGQQCAQKLLNSKEPLLIDRVTTDADGCLAQGVTSCMQSKDAGMAIEHLLDPPHLNRSLCAAVSHAKFTKDMFPAQTKKERTKLQDRFADDVSHRAQAEAAAIMKKSGGNLTKMTAMSENAVKAIVTCYSGNHDNCRKWSLICKGGKYKFPYLPVDVRGKLKITPTDEETLLKALSKRLCQEALEKTRYGTSTQKAESMNHAFSVTNPKGTLTFSRNGSCRDHSAVHLVNNGHANSIVKKCKAAGCPVSGGSPAAKALAEMNKKKKFYAKRAKGQEYKTRRAQLRSQRFHLYYTTQKLYKRSKLDPKPKPGCASKCHTNIISIEHNYCKRY